MGLGEITLGLSDLEAVFGRPGVQLLTRQRPLLDLKFSRKGAPPSAEAAHVDVSGDFAGFTGGMARLSFWRGPAVLKDLGRRRIGAGPSPQFL